MELKIEVYGPPGLVKEFFMLDPDGSCACSIYTGLDLFGENIIWLWDDSRKGYKPICVMLHEENEESLYWLEEHGMIPEKTLNYIRRSWLKHPKKARKHIFLMRERLRVVPQDRDVKYTLTIKSRKPRQKK